MKITRKIKMRVTAYDFETTGPVPANCEPLQLGIMDVTIHENGDYTVNSYLDQLMTIKADEVPEGAYRVHGINKGMTVGSNCPRTLISSNLNNVTVLGYNNTSFDDTIAKRYGAHIANSIDMFTAARRMKSEGVIEKATLSGAYTALTGEEPENAHDALSDVKMTLALIKPVMAHYKFETFSELVTFLQTFKADVNLKMPFGKHKGIALKDLPKSYVQWAKKNMSLTGELKASFDLL